MKKSLRFASAALALTLAAGCAMPAFAAGKSSFSKSETVYAVMNGDGSIKSTTVSEHLYSASGLANVTDKTTLTDIQNTESDAEFTQNGEELVWNTNDTDVYYKGNTDKALPIDVKVTYALDGQEAALEDIIGKSGHLTVTVNLKNNETGTVNVNGTDRTIVTPLVTAVGVIFGQDATNVVAAHGLVESAAKSNVAAFVTLPGVKDSLEGLLPEQVNGVAEYLQDSVTVEADVESLTAPQILLACAASAEALVEQTGCDGIMIGRGAEGNPWIFKQILHYMQTGETLARPTQHEVKEMMLRHARMQVEYKGGAIGIREMRKHVAWYTAGFPHSAKLRAAINQVESLQALEQMLNEWERG